LSKQLWSKLRAEPTQLTGMARLAGSLPAPLRAGLAALLFLVIWALLNAAINLRHPGRDVARGYWFFLPAIDVCVLLAVYALLGSWGRRPMFGATLAVAIFILVVRLYRIADGLVRENYYREVKLYVDLPLLPDLWRLLRMTVPWPRLMLGCLILLALLAVAIVLLHLALVHQQRYLARGRRERGLLAVVLIACAVMSPRVPAGAASVGLRHGLFTASVAPLAVSQVHYALSAARFRRMKTREIRTVQERLRRTPSNLEKLRGADFLLFVVESYGSAAFRQRIKTGTGCPNLEEFSASLLGKGYFTASKLLNSTTYGGGSWFAHTSLRTGVAVRDSLEFAVVMQMNPPPHTLARSFQKAGYRTVLVQPGATRRWPEGLVHGFDRRYYAFDLEYEGPSFSWAPMPDQYTIHTIHRKEMERARAPLFVEYSLVSSHAPWTHLPTAIEDWSAIGRGEIFKSSPGIRFPTSWTNMAEGAVAYSYSLCYDFDVMRRYITERISRESFIVILGDHQPPGAITYDDPSWAVPVHVISRDRELIDRFVASGYAAGMIPADDGGPIAGMETFLTEFLTRLSRPIADD
jgi:hypothetical protein